MNNKKERSRRSKKSSESETETSSRTRRSKPQKEDETSEEIIARHKKLRNSSRNGSKTVVSSDSGTSEPSTSGSSTPRPGSLETSRDASNESSPMPEVQVPVAEPKLASRHSEEKTDGPSTIGNDRNKDVSHKEKVNGNGKRKVHIESVHDSEDDEETDSALSGDDDGTQGDSSTPVTPVRTALKRPHEGAESATPQKKFAVDIHELKGQRVLARKGEAFFPGTIKSGAGKVYLGFI